MGLGTMTALALAWSVQAPSFAAPVAAFFGLLPSNVCTWRNLLPRLLLTGASVLITIPLAGVLVQAPWFLLPAFFAGVALVAYFSPVTHRPLEMLAILYPFITGFFRAVFDPVGMPTAVGEISYAYAIGIVTATLFSPLLSPDNAVATLANSLAPGFARARALPRSPHATPPSGSSPSWARRRFPLNLRTTCNCWSASGRKTAIGRTFPGYP
jgi:hypothetical protein